MKRKADTTTPGSGIGGLPVKVDLDYHTDDTMTPTAAARLTNRRESHRQIKKPKKDLPEDHPQHSSKPKKGRLSTQLKYCNLILKELLAKKHAVSRIFSSLS